MLTHIPTHIPKSSQRLEGVGARTSYNKPNHNDTKAATTKIEFTVTNQQIKDSNEEQPQIRTVSNIVIVYNTNKL